MIRNRILKVFFLFFAASIAFAHGAKDVEEQNVENLQSWQESFSLEGKKAGKYNIFVTASDLGGNVAMEGPFNLYIDPKSDLPVTGITNPHPNMRIQGNLNIVGTCIDDDAVDYVELILDGDEENPVRANGKEFWSYYLDTNKLEEGPHTIKVVGCDINGMVGEPVSLTWQLDRNQPISSVTNHEMGVLVAKTVKFRGLVTDGNGIDKLEYSIDGGRYFKEVRLIRRKNGNTEFSVSVDTKKLPDGASVLWLRATDKAGSVGVYSFLYFIDNTNPDVKIVTPAEKEVQFGEIAITGYAKDKIGIKSIEWEFGSQKGQFELVPGNPYWGQVFDLAGTNDKVRKFTITATDIAGNVVKVSRDILINEELDKPFVTIDYPTASTFIESTDEVFVRGVAGDDDGIRSVKYKIDNGAWISEETKGVFCGHILNGSELSAGRHTVTVVATDRRGVEGNPVSVTFGARGNVPEFGDVKVGGQKLVNGMSVHPEAGFSLQIPITSSLGLSSVTVQKKWGQSGSSEDTYPLGGVSSYSLNIPVDQNMPKGVVYFDVVATDTADRKTEYHCLLNVVNTYELTAPAFKVIFDDTNVSSTGKIVGDPEFPVSGYVVGGNARSVELIPRTRFATVKLDGNSIILTPTEVEGVSEPFVIRVTSDKGTVADSQKLMITNGYSAPVVTIKDTDGRNALELKEGSADITGTVSSAGTIESLFYKVYGAKVSMSAGLLTGVTPINVADAPVKELPIGKTFSFTESFDYGIYVVEVTAVNSAGLRSSAAIAFRNIPNAPADAKTSPKAPVITWIDAEEVYYVATYQGYLSRNFGYFKRNVMAEGSNNLTASVTAGDKTITSKISVSKSKNIKANFVSIGDQTYTSGKIIELNKGETKNLVAYVDTILPSISANYEITGESVPGGADKSTGSASVVKDAGNRYVVTIPLSNLPVRMNRIRLTVKSGTVSKEFCANVGVIRTKPADADISKEGIYTQFKANGFYDADSSSYVIKSGESLDFYPQIPGLVSSADFVSPQDGLEISNTETLVTVKAVKDGIYPNVAVRVKDINQVSYTSKNVRLIVDSGAPEVNISTPAPHAWVKRSVRLTGTVADPNGIKSADYSVDGGETWVPLALTLTGKGGIGGTFAATIDVSSSEDGLVKIDVRAYDVAGKCTVAHGAAFKDTTPPEAEVLVPNSDDIVNGENFIAFKVKDNGSFERAFYVAPPNASVSSKRQEIEHNNKFVTTYVGGADRPIDDAMEFQFVDDAENSSSLAAWQFIIDRDSDLPITEIHLPTENEVITRDFTISGVVYDDDGPATVFYRIDNEPYKQLSEMTSSFAIDIPFETMTDNEHVISVYAVDIQGVKGPVVERKIRVSTEEPKGAVLLPKIDTANKGVVVISGVSSDKNGIEKVMVSVDNGNSYNNAIGTEEWSYTFDTRAIPNGTNVVFLKVVDKYGIEALYSSLINIDNLAPEMILDYPLDYSSTAGPLFFSGYAFDNIDITELFISIRSLEGKSVPRSMQRVDFKKDRIIAQDLDISSLENGSYNIEITALDKAMNATHISRNITLNKNKPLATVNLLYPLNGEHKQGQFNIYGNAEADKPIEKLSLFIDNEFIADTELTASEYFVFNVSADMMESGVHKYRVDATVEGGKVISSRTQTVDYSTSGPWVKIDNFAYGDFAIERPYIIGSAGYALDGEETEISKVNLKSVPKDQKQDVILAKSVIANKKVQKIELSFDNGKTFDLVSKGEKWMYRVENQDLAEGYHFMLVRATMKNGETAIERTIIQIDNTAPKIRLITPSQGGRYNQELVFNGLSSDDVGLKDVKLTLRKGDKASYEVPSFIQGLYLDWHFWGATLFDIGVGLTFFDDAVKVQFQWGQFTQAQRDMFSKSDMRYGGDNVMGIKILANIAQIPFSYFLGHDWEWLSSSVAIGAQFTRFNESGSGDAQILSALLAQLEFPKVTFPKMKMFSSFSAYTEFSLWFIPTDVSGGDVDIDNLVPQISEGIRVNVF